MMKTLPKIDKLKKKLSKKKNLRTFIKNYLTKYKFKTSISNPLLV